jgi:exosortase
LQLVIADIVRILSKLFGIPVAVQGATIESLDGSFARMEVAGGCSGIRSIMAMLMLAALYGYFAHRQWWKQAILFGSAIAFAFLGNLARVFSIVLVAKFIDPKIATTLYHDYSGFIFFPVAVLAMVTMSNTLEMDFGKWFRRWFKPDPVRAGGVGADAAGSGSPGNDQMQPTATTPKTGGISYDY